MAALPAFAILLAVAFLRKFQGKFPDSAIAVLFSFCVAVSVGAAVLGIYPLGGIRQVIYLGPVIFLTAGVAIHSMADSLAALTGRAVAGAALAAAAAGAIALAGVGTIRQDSPYGAWENAEAIVAFLEENVEAGDLVLATETTAPAIMFYQGENSSSYHYGKVGCWGGDTMKKCIQEMAGLVASLPNVPNRIFLVYQWKKDGSIWDVFGLLGEQVSVEAITIDGLLQVSLIANAKEFRTPALRSAKRRLLSGEPAIRSDFDVHISDDTLVYVKKPCARADTQATFFLHLHPVDVNDLPDHRRQYGFDHFDFRFDERGPMVFDGGCMARIPLPEYDIATIITGQYNDEGRLWAGEHNFDE